MSKKIFLFTTTHRAFGIFVTQVIIVMDERTLFDREFHEPFFLYENTIIDDKWCILLVIHSFCGWWILCVCVCVCVRCLYILNG